MPVYMERRRGVTTGRVIGEVTIGGTRFRERFNSPAEAHRWVALSKALGSPAPVAGKHTGPEHPWATVAAEARRKRSKWRQTRDVSLDQRLEVLTSLLDDTPIQSITTHTLYGVVERLEDRGVSPATINRYLAVASGVLSYAKSVGYREGVPDIPWQTEAAGRLHVLSRAWEDAICARVSAREALVVRCLAETGLRPGREFFTLSSDQVDIMEPRGEAWIHLWQTKTNRPRSVPIPVPLARGLKRMIAAGDLPPAEEVYRNFKRAVEALRLPKELTLYSLRHTAGTRLAQSGASGPVIQRWLGHASYRTTQRYVHMADEDLMRAAKQMEKGVRETVAA